MSGKSPTFSREQVLTQRLLLFAEKDLQVSTDTLVNICYSIYLSLTVSQADTVEGAFNKVIADAEKAGGVVSKLWLARPDNEANKLLV